MNATDIFALGGRQADAELIALEAELTKTRARFDERPLADKDAYALAGECRELERRINETIPQTATGVAVKLRQVLYVLDEGCDLHDDEMESLRQLLAFAEAAP